MRYIILSLALLSSVAIAEMPKTDNLGVGGMIGTESSIGAKYFVMDQLAVDGNIEFMDHPWHVMYADAIWHFPRARRSRYPILRQGTFYAGAGLGVGFWDRLDTCGRWNCHWNSDPTSSGTGTGLFIRGSVGFEWKPVRQRWSAFGEIDPSYMYYPGGASTIDIAVGARYYFSI